MQTPNDHRPPAAEPTGPSIRRRTAAALVVAVMGAVLLSAGNPTGPVLPPAGAPLRAEDATGLTVAHRGDQVHAPENTMPAFEAAFASGAELIETDVRLSSDGVPVLIHDASVDRTTNGSGRVAGKTLTELRRLDAGAWFDRDFIGTPIPMLTELLDLLLEHEDPRARVMLELKGTWRMEDVRGLTDEVRDRDLVDRVIVGSFSPVTLSHLMNAAPRIARVVIRNELPRDVAQWVRMAGASAVLTTQGSLLNRPDAVAELEAMRVDILVYTLNDEASWHRVVAAGANGIITDYASDLRPWMARHARNDGLVIARATQERILAPGDEHGLPIASGADEVTKR